MKEETNNNQIHVDDEGSIAIIAMECKIPQASNVDELWALLMEEKCTITELSDDQIRRSGVSDAVMNNSNFVKKAGVLENVDKFDSRYFEVSEKEADVLDVQQRMMLESAMTLLNRGNIDPARYNQRIGVFAGSAFSSYLFGVLEREDLLDSLGEMVIRHGNDKDFLSTRISYKLNLKGPSLNVQTSCSTGLVAVHVACQSLLLNECDAAIAGAVSIKLPQDAGYMYQQDGILASDGLCRPFDSKSSGTIFTNGLGLVLLKRLSDAISDGDEIFAIIKGSAINNDGSQKVGFTAPSVSGQVNALSSAIQISGINCEDIQYIEAHGTGTALGDPIEIEAIKQAYGELGNPCGIGSLKGNFGHFNIAAGVIGLIKAALILKHKKIPATLHVKTVNPNLELEKSRFYVADRANELESSNSSIVAVSAFGIGGTNSHVILESYDDQLKIAKSAEEKYKIFTFSAKTTEALGRLTEHHQNYFASNPISSFSDAAYTAYFCRPLLLNRISLVAKNYKEASDLLKSNQYNRYVTQESKSIAFVFSGQGTQHVNMGQVLARESTQFRQHLESILDLFAVEHGLKLSTYLWNPNSESDISSTLITQPLLFAVEFSLAKTLIELGVTPDYVFGHSLGEVIAATIAGVFDLQTAAGLVVRRSQCMFQSEPGAMVAVESLEGLETLLRDFKVFVAAHNSSKQFVISGSFANVDAAIEILKAKGLFHQRLKTSHAFHSNMMDAAAVDFLEFMKGVSFNDARIPMISNITGQKLTEYEYKNPNYWADHLLKTVQFSKSVQTLHQLGVRNFVEIGHGYAMSNLLKSNAFGKQGEELKIVQALGSEDEEYVSFLNVVAFYWTLNDRFDLSSFIGIGRKVDLPVYPFDRIRHWVNPVNGFRVRGRSAVEIFTPVQPVEDQIDRRSNSVIEAVETLQTNPVELIVAETYVTYLGGDDSIDRKLSFFDLGGNSLVAIQMINKLRETFKIDIPLRGFYENSSIAAISLQITNTMLEEAEYV